MQAHRPTQESPGEHALAGSTWPVASPPCVEIELIPNEAQRKGRDAFEVNRQEVRESGRATDNVFRQIST
jgi:hypothetical protein